MDSIEQLIERGPEPFPLAMPSRLDTLFESRLGHERGNVLKA